MLSTLRINAWASCWRLTMEFRSEDRASDLADKSWRSSCYIKNHTMTEVCKKGADFMGFSNRVLQYEPSG